jgi:hypothetical protein
MKVSEFKAVAATLSRFATTREKAQPPESLIGVQNKAGRLRLIAGSEVAGVVVPIEEYEGPADCAYTISARPFLQAAKILPAKSEVTFSVTPEMLVLTASGGGTINLEAGGFIKNAGFVKKPKDFKASARVYGENWKRMANLFKNIGEQVEVPSIQIIGDKAYATAVSHDPRAKYASLVLHEATGPTDYNMAAYLDFWVGLFSFVSDGTIQWGPSGVLATSGGHECFSGPYLLSRYNSETRTSETAREAPPWPILRIDGELPVGFTVARNDLTTVIKGQAPFDQLNRVTLEVDTDFVKVSPYGSESGQKFPAETYGRGIRSVSSEYLKDILSSMDCKQVTLRWGGSSKAISITGQGYDEWTILLAPVGL